MINLKGKKQNNVIQQMLENSKKKYNKAFSVALICILTFLVLPFGGGLARQILAFESSTAAARPMELKLAV